MKRKPFEVLISYFAKHPTDSVEERKETLEAIAAITPEKCKKHDQLCMCLKNLHYHDNAINELKK